MQADGLVNLDPNIFEKVTGKKKKRGSRIGCVVCSKHRSYSDGNVCLRRPFYEYCYYQHCQNATHINARNLWDRAKKNKTDNKPSLNQTMLRNYFSKAIKKPKKKNDNLHAESANLEYFD